ncbi:MAG: O-methyltransferase [Solirubrobacterales bacterium]
MQASTRLTPSSAAKGAAHRLAMTRALARIAGRRDPASRAVAKALRAAAAGRLPAEERAWIRRIESRRAELIAKQSDQTPEELGVFGIAEAVRWMSVPPVLGRFLMRLVRELAPSSSIEVGTGLGLSGAYQGAALELNERGRLITVDVVEAHAVLAREGFGELGIGRVEVRVGEPATVLETALADAAPVGYAFVDADHQEAPTLACFDAMLPHLGPGAVIVFDDVGFSIPEMARAWSTIAAHERVSAAVPIGRLGVTVLKRSWEAR